MRPYVHFSRSSDFVSVFTEVVLNVLEPIHRNVFRLMQCEFQRYFSPNNLEASGIYLRIDIFLIIGIPRDFAMWRGIFPFVNGWIFQRKRITSLNAIET